MKPYVAGEFSPQKSVWMCWPIGEWATRQLNVDRVALEMVKNMPTDLDIHIVCFDANVKTRANNLIKKNLRQTDHIHYVEYPAPIIYPRDFGIDVIQSGNELAHVHHLFDSYGYYGLEDETSQVLNQFSLFQAECLGIKNCIKTDLITEGGNHEFNGAGVMMAIEDTEVKKRNSHKTKEEIEQTFKNVYGLEKIIWIPHGSYEDEHYLMGPIPGPTGKFDAYRSASANGHIDEICRFASEDTIVLARVTEEEAKDNLIHQYNKVRMDAAFDVLKEATQSNGEPFKIVTLPMPEPIYIELTPEDDAYYLWEPINEQETLLDGSSFPTKKITVLPALSYCNFLILNEVVLAQSYYEPGLPLSLKEKDKEALAALQVIFPDKQVIPIHTLALNLYGGGIHCNTKNIPRYDCDI